MNKILEKYIQSVTSKFSYVESSEMAYRTDLEIALRGIFESIKVQRIDHDAKAVKGNKPDFVIRKNDVPILYIEVKNLGTPLDKVEQSEQMARYYGYANLILSDYVEFRFYRNGERYGEPIKIADYSVKNRTIDPNPQNYDYLAKTLVDFTQSHKEPIKSAKHLAKIMGGKGQRLRDNVRHLFEIGSENNSDLEKLYLTIKELLVGDLTYHNFADMYAQTLVYGLFVARFHDKSLDNFTRQEARELIPNSNNFLRHFFDHITGAEFKSSLKYIVDELCEVFSYADVEELMREYFKNNLEDKLNDKDPVIHFYEDFLQEYDPELRKKMGAYYTPLPVVRFIVKSVDEILKRDFKLSNGLADTSKSLKGSHKVQILDPAVGTGTFLSEIIEHIYKNFSGQEGRWPSYVHNELLPRLYGFELMMTPYTISHLKLGIELKRKGFWDFHRRLGIYLTNSLEQGIDQQQMFAFGLAESIAEESKEAAEIKNDRPIMIIVGNPPYSGISSNETEYANSLVQKYKVEPGGNQKLREKKHWLNDDYVKFIAMSESMIDKNGEGIMAMITNNGYLDNPTFRGMRWHLAKTFDEIYILNLHGNAKKRERAPDNEADENVFDIMQGVAVILAVKTGNKELGELAKVYQADIYGKRTHKFNELSKVPSWQLIELDAKMLYFVSKNNQGRSEYETGFNIDELFGKSTTGILTMGDNFIVGDDKNIISNRIQRLINGDYTKNYLNNEFKLGKNYADFILKSKSDMIFDENKLSKITYRPFDNKWTYFDNNVIWRWRFDVSKNIHNKENLVIGYARSQKDKEFNAVFVSRNLMEAKSTERSVQSSFAPLYLYAEDGTRTTNFNPEIVKKITSIVGDVAPEDIFDYIYAVLNSLKYRAKYKEFLKIDFPKIPYPKTKNNFNMLVRLGRDLRNLHLLESPMLINYTTTYSIFGDNLIEKIDYKEGDVWINEKQFFGNVSENAWNFSIGGYQPAQKWLKDRKGRQLTNEEIEHYQKIIKALFETDKIMKELDEYLYL